MKADLAAGTIHKNYNQWVRELESTIVQYVSTTPPYRELYVTGGRPDLTSRNLKAHIFSRNYVAGERKRVFTGELMIRVKDYWIVYDSVATALSVRSLELTTPRMDGLSAPGGTLRVPIGVQHNVVGSFEDPFTEESKLFFIVRVFR